MNLKDYAELSYDSRKEAIKALSLADTYKWILELLDENKNLNKNRGKYRKLADYNFRIIGLFLELKKSIEHLIERGGIVPITKAVLLMKMEIYKDITLNGDAFNVYTLRELIKSYQSKLENMCFEYIQKLDDSRPINFDFLPTTTSNDIDEMFRVPHIEEFVEGFTYEIYSKTDLDFYSINSDENLIGWHEYTIGRDCFRHLDDFEKELERGFIRVHV